MPKTTTAPSRSAPRTGTSARVRSQVVMANQIAIAPAIRPANVLNSVMAFLRTSIISLLLRRQAGAPGSPDPALLAHVAPRGGVKAVRQRLADLLVLGAGRGLPDLLEVPAGRGDRPLA